MWECHTIFEDSLKQSHAILINTQYFEFTSTSKSMKLDFKKSHTIPLEHEILT